MSKAFLIAAAALCSVLIVSELAVAQVAGAGKIGPSVAWVSVPGSFVSTVKEACGKRTDPGECLTVQMQKAGASADAVGFSHALYQANHEAGYMSSFNHVGPVDIAWVVYPLRARSVYGLLLVNGSPAIVNAEDLKLLDNKGLQQSLQYQTLKGQFSKVGLWPGDRDGTTWPESQSGPNGGVQFTLGYPLRNGCPTCAHAGVALFNWNFDASGKFQGTSFMGITSPPLHSSGQPNAMLH